MGSTVQVGAWQISSNEESAAEMTEALKQGQPEKDAPKIKPIRDRGQDVAKEPKPPLTVSEAGKKGGEAAAKAREERAKADDKTVDTKTVEAEAKPKETRAEPVDKTVDKSDDKAEAKPAEEEHDDENPRSSAQARIRQLAREKAEARQLAQEALAAKQELEARLSRLERGERPAERQEARPAQRQADGDDPEPNVDDFAEWTDYNKAQARWEARQEFKRVQTEERMRQRAEAQALYHREQQAKFVEKFSAAKDVTDKIDQELLSMLATTPPGERPTPSSTVADEVFQADHPAHILAFFTEHPEEVRRLVGMPDPRSIARAVAQLDAKFAAQPGTEEPDRFTPAPPPVKPLSSSAQRSEPDLTGEMSLDEYIRRNKGKR